ncbi:MAG: zinc-dependent metalloprotease [Flavobacteriaceae bacterium]|nr:zinc-dependent metalloprotease [Flavobacteriaceae bacterium]
MKYLKLLFVISVLFLFSCQNTDEVFIPQDSSLNQDQSPVIAKLVAMGYDREMIKEYDDFFLVEGDLMFSKNIKDYPAISDTFTKQAVNNSNLLDLTKTNISVYIDNSMPSSGQDNWRTAISSAINDWNSISGSSVYFNLSTNSNADITIKSDNGALPNNVVASAGFPSNGNPYNTVLVNLDFLNINVSEGSKRYNMVHELGHCIGLRHTNWDSQNEYSANTIPGTPNGDSNSVMNGGTALFTWNSFSTYDIIAAQYLFPYSVKVEYENVYNSYDPDTFERVDDVYVKLYTNGSYTTPLSLPATVKYSIKTLFTEGQSAGQTTTSNYTKTISSGSGNRYFLTDITREYCEYDYGNPVGDCYQEWVSNF